MQCHSLNDVIQSTNLTKRLRPVDDAENFLKNNDQTLSFVRLRHKTKLAVIRGS